MAWSHVQRNGLCTARQDRAAHTVSVLCLLWVCVSVYATLTSAAGNLHHEPAWSHSGGPSAAPVWQRQKRETERQIDRRKKAVAATCGAVKWSQVKYNFSSEFRSAQVPNRPSNFTAEINIFTTCNKKLFSALRIISPFKQLYNGQLLIWLF